MILTLRLATLALMLGVGASVAAEGDDSKQCGCEKPDAAVAYLVQADIKHPARLLVSPAVLRGSMVFNSYCTLCHGVNADGNGRAAKLHTPRPANLLTSQFPPEYKKMIISEGGEKMGRSAAMPPWKDELTEEQISDLISFLTAIAEAHKAQTTSAEAKATP